MTVPFVAPAADMTMIVPRFIVLDDLAGHHYYAVIPPGMRKGARPLVVVHGISRNAAELALRFGEMARIECVPIIAPLFEKASFGRYQQVRDPGALPPSDGALCAILADAAERFGIDASQVDLFGFSGGAQFAHRFAMLHPSCVRHCIAAAAGWYTMPDEARPWPLGWREAPCPIDSRALGNVRFDILIGELDRQQDKALRRSPELDATQGIHRLQRARRWHRAMRRKGLPVGLTVIPGLSHAFGDAVHLGIVPLVFQLLGTNRAKSEEPET